MGYYLQIISHPCNITYERLCVFREDEVYIIIAVTHLLEFLFVLLRAFHFFVSRATSSSKKLFNCSGFRHVQWTLINLIGCKIFTHMRGVSWLQLTQPDTQQCTVKATQKAQSDTLIQTLTEQRGWSFIMATAWICAGNIFLQRGAPLFE